MSRVPSILITTMDQTGGSPKLHPTRSNSFLVAFGTVVVDSGIGGPGIVVGPVTTTGMIGVLVTMTGTETGSVTITGFEVELATTLFSVETGAGSSRAARI